MTDRIRSEIKIIGINFFLVSAAFAAALIALAAIAGELLDFYPVCFEVLFPFYAAIAAGEWGKTRADGSFDIIAAQSISLFKWVLLRYITIFGITSIFAACSMAGSSLIRREWPLWEALVVYFPPAFFLSSLGVLAGVLCGKEHIPIAVCGALWLAVLFASSLLRLPGMEYVYLFIRFAGEQSRVWLWNKTVITAAGLLLWGLIYGSCGRAHTAG